MASASHIASLFYRMTGHSAGLAYPNRTLHDAPLRIHDGTGHVDSLKYRGETVHKSAIAYVLPGSSSHAAGLAYRLSRAHASPLPVTNRATHAAGLAYSVPGRTAHAASLIYTMQPLRQSAHAAQLRYANASAHLAGLAFALRSPHIAGLVYAPSKQTVHTAGLRYGLETSHAAGLAILTTDPGRTRHVATMPIYERASRELAGTAELLRGGVSVEFLSCDLAREQGQAYWSADVELAEVEDYHRFPIGQAFSVSFAGTVYAFVVDRRQLTLDGPASKRPAIRGLSSCALFDAPFADGIVRTWDTPMMASAIVADVLSGVSVTWAMVDWMIPAYRLAVDGMTPMAVAARVAEAAGGVIEAMPDGSVLIRPAYPVSVPNMDASAADADLNVYDDIYDVSEALDAARGMNRVRVYDTSPNVALNDRLEWAPDEDNGRQGVVRAYPSPWRTNLLLRHSRGSAVVLTPQGEVVRTIADELIEIKSGEGSTAYPVLSLQSAKYESDVLGGISVEPYTNELRTAIAGYSLLRLTYTTKSIDHAAVANADLVTQMILEET